MEMKDGKKELKLDRGTCIGEQRSHGEQAKGGDGRGQLGNRLREGTSQAKSAGLGAAKPNRPRQHAQA
jgi:hypothetical protein